MTHRERKEFIAGLWEQFHGRAYPRGLALTFFYSALFEKMLAGGEQYGDASLELSAVNLADEVSQEYLDIVGWSLLLDRAIQHLQTLDSLPVTEGDYIRLSLIRDELSAKCKEAIKSWHDIQCSTSELNRILSQLKRSDSDRK